MTRRTRIPNLDTLSTLFDRLSIENVKLAHFENTLEHDQLTDDQRTEFQGKIATQQRIISPIKDELAGLMEEILFANSYDYIKEERTFK